MNEPLLLVVPDRRTGSLSFRSLVRVARGRDAVGAVAVGPERVVPPAQDHPHTRGLRPGTETDTSAARCARVASFPHPSMSVRSYVWLPK